MNGLIVIIISLLLIGLIVWWFLMKPETDIVAANSDGKQQSITIVVDGGYTPNRIQLQKGIPAKLTFLRKDKSSCFGEVVLPDFGVSAKLPVNKDFLITVQPDVTGRYTYSCGMHMFFGEVFVV